MKKYLITCLAFAFPTLANAFDIQELKTQSGIKFWLVESHALPFVSAEVSFRAGYAFETEDTKGLSALTASLLNEGTQAFSSTQYKEKMERLGSGVSASSSKLNLTVSVQSLSENVNETFGLMADGVFAPRFETSDFKRMQTQTLASIKQQEENPASDASKRFKKALYGNHTYGNDALGDAAAIAGYNTSDVKAFHASAIQCTNMALSIVGDITAKNALEMVENTIAPHCVDTATSRLKITEEFDTPVPSLMRISRDIPQSTILLGHKGISRNHDDYFASYVMNYILGGGGFNSRLMKEIREKRGLAYGAYSYFDYAPLGGAFVASVNTKNKDVDTVIGLLKTEMNKMQRTGVTQAEYDGAIKYLTGSFPLRLASNAKILSYLSVMQMENLGVDYISSWQNNIRNVTLDDVNRVAKKLLKPDDAVVVVVGGEG